MYLFYIRRIVNLKRTRMWWKSGLQCRTRHLLFRNISRERVLRRSHRVELKLVAYVASFHGLQYRKEGRRLCGGDSYVD